MSVAINLHSLCRHVADERPRTVAQEQRTRFTLLEEPQKPTARRAPISLDWDRIIHEPSYQNLITFTAWILGRPEFERNGSLWRKVAFERPRALHQALLELRLMRTEGREPKNPGAYLTTMLKNQS